MIHKLFTSTLEALRNIRAHLLHTVLSTLGIIIGVASLVAILSLIDGMEKFAQDQISQTTSLNAVVIDPQPYRNVNDVRIAKDSITFITPALFTTFVGTLPAPARATMVCHVNGEVRYGDKSFGAQQSALSGAFRARMKVVLGQLPDSLAFQQGAAVCIINQALATALGIKAGLPDTAIVVGTHALRIAAVIEERNTSPHIIYPAALLQETDFRRSPPQIILEAGQVTDVARLKEHARQWLSAQPTLHGDDFEVRSNEMRVEQAAKGFRLFRIIMGLIVGISVVVGGVGIMNVLVISVTERTREIGLRKAVGARRRDIVLQFLAESVVISVFGSILGLITGIVGTLIAVPIVRAVTKVPFQSNFTLNTLVVIAVVAILTGIVFGTYPALKAARLDPVDAIRHE